MNIEEWSGYEVSSEVLEQAASWITMLDSSESLDSGQALGRSQAAVNQIYGSNEDMHTRFFDWLQAEPAHQQAYFELSEMWARSACTKSMSDMIDKSVVLPFPTLTDKPSQVELLEPVFGKQSASPSWAYSLTIGLIFCGLAVPAIQSCF